MSSKLQWVGWGTLIVFPVLGALLLFLFGKPVAAVMFRSEINVVLQIGAGGFIGTLLGLGGRWIITRPIILPSLDKYAHIVKSMRLKTQHVYFLSFCAGFGEELFFRGAMQPLTGIWIAAIFFVAIHGYLNPYKWRISIYGIYMTLSIALLGYLTEIWGIFTACAAHMAIDVVLFNFLIRFADEKIAYENSYEESSDEIETDVEP
ncbi:MAG: CPBP family intramembrane glutamic endopeptidase [Cryomorphaceae bacterium]